MTICVKLIDKSTYGDSCSNLLWRVQRHFWKFWQVSNKKFENFGEPQLKMVSPGLI